MLGSADLFDQLRQFARLTGSVVCAGGIESSSVRVETEENRDGFEQEAFQLADFRWLISGGRGSFQGSVRGSPYHGNRTACQESRKSRVFRKFAVDDPPGGVGYFWRLVSGPVVPLHGRVSSRWHQAS